MAKPIETADSQAGGSPVSIESDGFAIVPTPEKQLVWEGQTRHVQSDKGSASIDGGVINVSGWLSQHLAAGHATSIPTDNDVASVRQRVACGAANDPGRAKTECEHGAGAPDGVGS